MRKQISSVVVMSVFLIVLNTTVFLGSGCTSSYNTPQPAAEVEVTDAPPAPIVEDVPRSPGEGYVWISGAWVWSDRWAWESGHWDRPPRPGAVWVPHRYAVHDGKHVFIRGGWQ
jgi:hypothetical protein